MDGSPIRDDYVDCHACRLVSSEQFHEKILR